MCNGGCCCLCLCWHSPCSNIGADQQLYDERDLEKSRERIESINFHETKDIGGIKVTPYHAGHVLGAAMFMIEIAGVKVRRLYLMCACVGWSAVGVESGLDHEMWHT